MKDKVTLLVLTLVMMAMTTVVGSQHYELRNFTIDSSVRVVIHRDGADATKNYSVMVGPLTNNNTCCNFFGDTESFHMRCSGMELQAREGILLIQQIKTDFKKDTSWRQGPDTTWSIPIQYCVSSAGVVDREHYKIVAVISFIGREMRRLGVPVSLTIFDENSEGARLVHEESPNGLTLHIYPR